MWKFIKKVFYYLALISIFSIVWGRFFNPIITITQIEGLVKYQKLDRDYISYDEMGKDVKKAVVASEDQRFFMHSGFDFNAIQKAVVHNQKGKKIRGGSTISQQTAKNIFLWNGGSYFRKGLEAIFTFVIEKVWNKDIILERYLNSIEMGQGVFGIEAASHYYFGKSSQDLSKSEAAWIAVILPSPQKYDPKNPSSSLRRKHSWVMRQMNNVVLK